MPPVRIKERGRAKKGTIKRLLAILFKNFPVQLITVAICLVYNIISNLASSIFVSSITEVLTRAITDNSNGSDALNAAFNGSYATSIMGIPFNTNITQLLIGLGIIYGLAVFAAWYWNRTMGIVTQKFMNLFRKKMFDKMETLPIKYFDTHAHGEIMSLYTNDIDTVRQFISQSLPSMFQTGLTALGIIFLMLTSSIWLSLVVLGGTVAMFMNTKVIGGRASKYFIKQQIAIGKTEGHIQEAMKGLKVIKVFTHEEESEAQFDELNNQLCKDMTEANINGNIMMPINGNIGNFVYVFVAALACTLYVTHARNLSVTGLQVLETAEFYKLIVAFLMYARMFSNNISQFSQNVTFIVMGMAGASRCFDLIDEKAEADEGYVTLVNIKYNDDGSFEETNEKTRFYAWKHPHSADGTITYTELKGDIVLENVDFGYVEDKIVLHNVSIYARPGEKIAFVGATGAGKTTITNLINRFYDIADGKIRYDGININKIKKDDLRKSLGIVLQDVNLFTGTVMDNIRYGRLDATDEECIEASKIANAYDFITRLPEGFNTMLNGDGSNLSQGQRQLISIARAAVADTPVMILDEATSSIDTRTEKLVQAGTDKLMEGRTVFVIAHRLSTVQNSNAIMVLDHGNIIERGTHKDLIAQKGTYYQLYTGAFELE
ncbi:MAG: ABC transporter ATP-binding protein/permease [Bacilli bacterium]|nr:ABC transporter ATP-binding protein/permease [Bacilli bacterium]